MTAARVQVADLAQARLTPEANPVDTYYRPQEKAVPLPVDSTVAQLAQSLGSLRPQLVELSGKYLDNQAKEENSAGNEAYRAALLKDGDLNKKAFKDLVDQGVIPAGASPWFQKGWREQQLRTMGDDYGRDLTLAWNANGDLKNTDDPTKLREFLANQQKAFREKVGSTGGAFRPTELTEVLDPIMDHYNKSVAGHQINHRVEEIQKQVETNTAIEVGRLAIRGEMSPEDRATGISTTVADLVSKGLSGSRANQIVTDAVVNAAVAGQNADLLTVMPLIKTGSGVLGETNYAKAKLHEAQQSIQRTKEHEAQMVWTESEHKYQIEVVRKRADEQWGHQQVMWKQAKEDHNRVTEERALSGSVAAFISRDPVADYRGTKEFKRLQELDPMKAEHMIAFHRQWIGSTEEQARADDKTSYVSLMRDIYAHPNEFESERLERSFLSGMITKQTYQQFHEDLRRAKSDHYDPLLGSKEFTDLVDATKKGIAGSPDGLFGVGGYNAELGSSQLRGWAREYAAQMKAEGKPVSVGTFIFEAQKKAKEIATQYNPEMASAGQTYGAQAGQGQAQQQQRPQQAQPQQQPRQAQPQQPRPQVVPLADAIRILRQNPTAESQAYFERNYRLKASDYLAPKPAGVVPLEEAVRILQQNPTAESRAYFEKNYGLKASEFVR